MKAAREHDDAERRAATTKPARPEVGAVGTAGRAAPSRSMSSLAVMRLQSRAGNAAVARLVGQRAAAGRRASAPPQPAHDGGGGGAAAGPGVQRLAEGGACPPAPVAPVPADPRAAPRFTAVEGRIEGSATTLKKHPSGAAEANKARGAAQPPSDDKAGQAKAAQVDNMATAKPKGFDKAGFVAAVKQAIAKAAPKNLDEADKFATSGKAEGVKSEVLGKVTQGKETSAKDVADKTTQPPDPSVAKDKPVTPLKEPPPPAPPAVDAAKAMPGKAPAEQTDMRGGPCEVKSTMADAGVTDKHLAASNEPQMQQAAAAKKGAEAHAAQAPGQIRQREADVLGQAQAGATADAKGALAAMAGAKGGATSQVGGRQNTAKANEEKERARISGEINKVYDRTKKEVEAILTGLDAKVTAEFDKGEADARREFTAKHKADMERYKDQRYSGAAGWARWTGDLFTGLPKEADQIFERAKALYEQKMTTVISGVADLIGRELDAAKAKIAAGRQEIKNFVATQPKALQKLADDAAGEMNGKFDQLESDVDAKQESLVDDLAQKYVEARNAVDEEIKAEQAKNTGFVDMAKNMVGESVKSILALKDLFMGLLAKAAAAFTMILDKPLQFITNFMSAVKQGFLNFADHILEHLKKGLQGWLFGQLASAGVELPEKFDLMGILKMVASLLGLTWNGIKARIAAKDPFLGTVIDQIQSKIEIFVVLATKGITGIWDWIKEKVGDLKQLVFDQIKSFIIEKIVKAGITWVLGMLNPAGALIKIVQALISVVQWIMERGAEMGEFIRTIIDAVMDVARGGGGGVPAKIEAALGKAVPLVISFLAGLLGLGGISEKVKSIIEKGQNLVGKAVDWVVGKALKMARPLINAMKKGAGWVKGKFAAGKAWVKGKYEAGKKWVKGKYEGAKAWVKGKVAGAKGWVKGKISGKEKPKPSPADRKAALDKAMAAGQKLLKKKGLAEEGIRKGLASIKSSKGVRRLELVVDSKSASAETVHIVGANSPTVHGPPVTRYFRPVQRAAEDGPEVTATGAAEQIGAGNVDPAEVKKARRQANAAQTVSAAAYADLQRELANAPKSAWDAIRNATFACQPGGVPRLQGGGTKEEAKASIAQAFRYAEAERQVENVRGGAQKEVYLAGGAVDLDDPTKPDEMRDMYKDAESLRKMRERMAARGVYVPTASVRDRGIFEKMTKEEAEAWRRQKAEEAAKDPSKRKRKSKEELEGPPAPPKKPKKEKTHEMVQVGSVLGSADATHAEKLVYGSGDRVIGVSRKMCGKCYSYFVSEARNLQPGQFILVDDGVSPRIFLPGGGVGSPFDY